MKMPSSKSAPEGQKRFASLSASLIFLCFLAGIPFVFLSADIDPVAHVRMLLYGVVGIGGCIFLLRKQNALSIGTDKIQKLAFGVVLCFTAWQLFSLAWGWSSMEGLLLVYVWLLALGLAWVLLQFLYQEPGRWRDFYRIMLLFGLTQGLVGFLQVWDVPIPWYLGFQDNFPVGSMVNPNLFGYALALSLPFSLYLVFTETKIWRIFAGFTTLFSGFMIWGSGGRGAILAAVVIGFAWGIYFIWDGKGSRTVHWIKTIMLLGGLAGMAWFAQPSVSKSNELNWERLEEAEGMIRPETNSIELRLILWQKSWQMTKDYPLTGIGAGNWKLHAPRYGLKGFGSRGEYGTDFFLRPHNDYLWVSAETGLPGILLWLSFLILTLVAGIRKLKRTRERSARLLIMSLLSILLAYWVMAFFNFPRERIFFQLLLAFAAAALLFEEQKKGQGRGLSLKVSLLGVFVGAGILGSLLIADGVAWGKIHQMDRQQNWEGVERFSKENPMNLLHLDPVSVAGQDFFTARSLSEQGKHEEALKYYLLTSKVSPWQFSNRYNLAGTRFILGETQAAIKGYEYLLERFPDFNELVYNLAKSFIISGKTEQAKRLMKNPWLDAKSAEYREIQGILTP